jgi:uncharacterized cupredoxin-like copper-binding protein
MTSRRLRLALVAAALVVAVAVSGLALVRPTGATTDAPLGPGDATVTLTVRHSHFSPEHLVVRSGALVRFVIRNDDPIGHEFIIGDDGVHRRHEAGTEPVHPPRPGEVSIPAGATAETTFRFEGTTASGTVRYACHLPGHFRYGMSGTVDVLPD